MRRQALVVLVLLAAPALADGRARPLSESDASMGKAAYLRECSSCHGERGRGDGPAAKFLDPKPRDFTTRMFKLRSTPSGEPPATTDVLQTLERGIPGSAMPSFAFLSPEERRQIAAYILSVADMLEEPEPAPVPDPGAPPPVTPASIARGKVVYEEQGCGSCHGALGKGDGPAAAQLKDDEGNPIPVRDFTGGTFRGGGGRLDLYLRFVTGMDGSPMPSFAESVQGADRWALVDYVTSLRVDPKPAAPPKDPIKAGREVAAKYSCRGCHVLDDGVGGEVGPDLRISGQKLNEEWVRTFLQDPRAPGKIYPWRPHRMPRLGLSSEEINVLARYVQAMGKRKAPPTPVDTTAFPADRLAEGKNLFTLRCSQCHTLGKVIEIPLAAQQGPDLSRVDGRVDYGWTQQWILDPRKIDPKTKMTVPGITAKEVESVRMFIWKVSREERAARGGAAGGR